MEDHKKCANCGEAIYYGLGTKTPKKYEKYHDGWKTEIWRHVDTEENSCKRTVSIPGEVYGSGDCF
jgi:hypothetical protein